MILDMVLYKCSIKHIRGCSSVVESQPSKLVVWVRFPSPAPLLKFYILIKIINARLQLSRIEQLPSKQQARSSNLFRRTIFFVNYSIRWVQLSRLERQIVVLEVVGSIPSIHPIFIVGYRQAVRHRTLTPAFRWFESIYPNH